MLKGYKTLIVNLLLAIAPVLEATNAVDIGLTGIGASLYSVAVVIVNIGLRVLTTTPIGKK
jgi:hypothetical protein